MFNNNQNLHKYMIIVKRLFRQSIDLDKSKNIIVTAFLRIIMTLKESSYNHVFILLSMLTVSFVAQTTQVIWNFVVVKIETHKKWETTRKISDYNNLGDNLLLNLVWNFSVNLQFHIWSYNVAMATFPTAPKWHPGLEMFQIMSVICHPWY